MLKKKHVNHWLRKTLDKETEKIVSEWTVEDLDAIEVSGDAWSEVGFKSYRTLHYPHFDICKPFEDWPNEQQEELFQSADVVLAEQVWEHLRYPFRACRNTLTMLRPGGRFLLTTPFLLRVHGIEDYSDCTRWTPEGMKYFLEECGFDPKAIQTFAWGNRECAASHILNDVWFDHQIGMNLENDPIYPCVVWAVATKPVGSEELPELEKSLPTSPDVREPTSPSAPTYISPSIDEASGDHLTSSSVVQKPFALLQFRWSRMSATS